MPSDGPVEDGPSEGAEAGSRERAPFDRDRTWNYLLFILARRMYTVDELRTKLKRRGVAPADAEPLLERLVELKLVSDPAYAEQYVRSRSASRGKFALRRELRRKGVAGELIDKELAGLNAEQQRGAAAELLVRNAWRYRPKAQRSAADLDGREGYDDPSLPGGGAPSRLEVAKARARAFAFLARRGFGVDAAQAALEEVGWFGDDDTP